MRKNRASSTALLVTEMFYLGKHRPKLQSLCEPVNMKIAAGCIRRAHPLGFVWLWLLNRRLFYYVARALETTFLPGFQAHIISRKHKIQTILETLINQHSVKQVVSLGSGYDGHLSLLAENEGLRCFEIDHPSTQRIKASVFDKKTKSPELIPADLNKKSLTAVLEENGVQNDESTVVIMEGLLMYLNRDKVESIFRQMQRYFDQELWILFSFIEPEASGRIQFENGSRIIDLSLKIQKEPLQWGILGAELSDFLAAMGLQIVEIVETELEGVVTAKGECLCLCRGQL